MSGYDVRWNHTTEQSEFQKKAEYSTLPGSNEVAFTAPLLATKNTPDSVPLRDTLKMQGTYVKKRIEQEAHDVADTIRQQIKRSIPGGDPEEEESNPRSRVLLLISIFAFICFAFLLGAFFNGGARSLVLWFIIALVLGFVFLGWSESTPATSEPNVSKKNTTIDAPSESKLRRVRILKWMALFAFICIGSLILFMSSGYFLIMLSIFAATAFVLALVLFVHHNILNFKNQRAEEIREFGEPMLSVNSMAVKSLLNGLFAILCIGVSLLAAAILFFGGGIISLFFFGIVLFFTALFSIFSILWAIRAFVSHPNRKPDNKLWVSVLGIILSMLAMTIIVAILRDLYQYM